MNFSLVSEIILSIVLGIVQGITEFLPISSTAHMRLVTAFLTQNKDIGLAASNVIQLGTTIAVIQYFWSDLKRFFLRLVHLILHPKEIAQFWTTGFSWITGKDKQDNANESANQTKQTDLLMWQVAMGTIPVVILGFLLKDFADNIRAISWIALFLVFGSILMSVSEWIHAKREQEPKSGQMQLWEVLLVGLFQCIAILPGMSRSGSTVSGALLLGRDRAQSVRFSFLLSVPTLLLAGLAGLWDVYKEIKVNGLHVLPTASAWGQRIDLSILGLGIAFVLSYIFGLVFLKWLLAYLSKNTFFPFVIYRIILAILLIGLVFLGWLS